MERSLYAELLRWKSESRRKPLLLQGARQVGKTYLLKKFAASEYSDVAYFNFEEAEDLSSLFASSLGAANCLETLSVYRGKRIEPESTLIIFDEIQACPRAITSLKYFCEEAPEQHVAAAGSLLGVSVGKETGFPVGKVNFMMLYPMTFLEYLTAQKETLLVDHLQRNVDFSPLPDILHNKLIKLLRFYLFLGGMPEVIGHYLENRDVARARAIQLEILKAYERDFSKYATAAEAIRISQVWNSVPNQLARENRKFKFRDVRKGGRASRFETAIEWLTKAGLIYKACNIKTPKLPLSGYVDDKSFKLFMMDSGLLGARLGLASDTIVNGDSLFSEFNGAFTENYVATHLIAAGFEELYYWTSSGKAEVDFVLPLREGIIPLEVKAGMSRKTKSLRVYSDKYGPDSVYRTSPRNFTKDADLVNIPLYAVSLLAGN